MQFLILGLSLGLSAGLSPGPLMTLVITTTLRDGFWHGLRVAIAPLITDLPIILLAVLVLDRLPDWTLAVVGLAGSLYVIYLGWETMRTGRDFSLDGTLAAAPASGHQSLLRGATVNALNPHPYMFWAVVGAPTLLAASAQGTGYAAVFLVGFYALLVGSKIAVAGLVASQSHWLSEAWYRRVLVALGALLIAFGLWLGWQTLVEVMA